MAGEQEIRVQPGSVSAKLSDLQTHVRTAFSRIKIPDPAEGSQVLTSFSDLYGRYIKAFDRYCESLGADVKTALDSLDTMSRTDSELAGPQPGTAGK